MWSGSLGFSGRTWSCMLATLCTQGWCNPDPGDFLYLGYYEEEAVRILAAYPHGKLGSDLIWIPVKFLGTLGGRRDPDSGKLFYLGYSGKTWSGSSASPQVVVIGDSITKKFFIILLMHILMYIRYIVIFTSDQTAFQLYKGFFSIFVINWTVLYKMYLWFCYVGVI